MKHFFYLFIALILSSGPLTATVHRVEAGGNSSVIPYYSPQNISIQVGDTVIWDVVLGKHNMKSTSGPVSFSSPDISAPGTWQFVFTVAGTYRYECDRFDHARTQFGFITVNPATEIQALSPEMLQVYPNPFSTTLNIQFTEEQHNASWHIYTPLGREVLNGKINGLPNATIDLGSVDEGMYMLVINREGILTTRRIRKTKL